MISIALIGPDGAGKTTVSKKLPAILPIPVKYVYMGVNPEASNIMLPTTRLLVWLKQFRGGNRPVAQQPKPVAGKHRPKSLPKRILGQLKSNIRIANRIGDELFRQGLAWYYQRRGYLVLFDRHFIADHYVDRDLHRQQTQTLSSRFRTFLLERVYPQPDLVIYLDAPADVLFARKGEGTLESLERRRAEYLGLGTRTKNFVVVDTVQQEDAVAHEVSSVIMEFYRSKSGRSIVSSGVASQRQS